MAFPPAHTPLWQVSNRVQALPSVHALPSGLAGFEHAPVAGLHVPGLWHWSWAGHTTAFPPGRAPGWERVELLEAAPSLNKNPAGLGHAPVAGSQVPGS